MRIELLTIFPRIFDSYLNETILKRAQKKGLVKINIHDLRKYTKDKHRTVDDRPYGGGPGMVLKIEPIYRAIKKLRILKKHRIILLTPVGKPFDQKKAKEYSKTNQLIFICGRYEGIDARVEKLVDEKISIGPYVLSGGELAALAVIEATVRLIPGVLGHKDSAKDDTFAKNKNYLEYPQYTRPAKFFNWAVPRILLSGNHQAIAKWRRQQKTIKK